MMDDILAKVKEISTRFKTLRFGEIIQGAVDTRLLGRNTNLFNLSDKQVLEALNSYTETLSRRKP